MKTKELIKQLQAQDPSGETEVVVGNVDIHFVSREPSYYDGPAKILIRDEAKKPYYDVVGVKIQYNGNKVQIHTLSLSDTICDDPEIPVDLSEVSEHWYDRTLQEIEKERAEMRKIIADIEKEKDR